MALSVSFLTQRWAKLIGGINEAVSFAGGTVQARADTLLGQYANLANQADVVDDLYDTSLDIQQDVREWATYLGGRSYAVLQAMSRDDSARPRSDSVPDLFLKLQRDMVAGAEAFDRPTVTATVAAANALGGSNAGDGYLIASEIEPVDGGQTYYATSEVIRVLCTGDSYSGEATAGSEPFLASGETAVGPLDYRWPKGSGATLALVAYDPDTAGILSGAKLDDADWTGTSLTDWSALGGTFGAAAAGIISKGTGATYTPDVDGAANVLFNGDGSIHLGIYQVLDQDLVRANTNYAIQFWLKASSGAGTTEFIASFRDGSAAIITDNAGTSQSVTVSAASVNGANGTWTRFAGVLRTPRNLPTELRLHLQTTTAVLANGRSLALDHVELVEMERLYPGSPYFAIGAGVTPFSRDDGFTVTVANSKGGRSSFVRALDGIFGLAAQDIRLQVSTTATVLDSRIG